MGFSNQWKRKAVAAHQGRAHARVQTSWGPRCLRRASARRFEISELRAHRLHLGEERQGHRKNIPPARRSRQRAPQARHYFADEPLPGAYRFRTRLSANAPARQNSLYDAGLGRPADFCAVHEPSREVALLVSEISGESNPRSLRLCGHAHLDQDESKRRVARLQRLRRTSRRPTTSYFPAITIRIASVYATCSCSRIRAASVRSLSPSSTGTAFCTMIAP